MCNSRSQPIIYSTSTNGSLRVTATIFEKQSEQVDLRSLDSSRASSLKANDAFMYYSIPSFKNAALLNKEVDDLSRQMPTDSFKRLRKETDEDASASVGSCLITRKTVISAECHPGLIYEEHMDINDDTDDDDNDDTDDEYDFLSAAVAAKRESMTMTAASA